MTPIQRKLLKYNRGYFMAIGLAMFLAGFSLQLISSELINFKQVLTVLGGLILGYGTGRCDQNACST